MLEIQTEMTEIFKQDLGGEEGHGHPDRGRGWNPSQSQASLKLLHWVDFYFVRCKHQIFGTLVFIIFS